MKVQQVQDSRNQHIVAVNRDGDMRCFFIDSSSHTASVAAENLRRDIARHGDAVLDFAALPKLRSRVAASGRVIFDLRA